MERYSEEFKTDLKRYTKKIKFETQIKCILFYTYIYCKIYRYDTG